MIRVIINGSQGRMGRSLAEAVKASPAFSLTAGISLPPFPAGGSVPLYETLEACLLHHQSDVLIDFSQPGALLPLLAAAKKGKVPLVLGTTGFSPEQEESIRRTAHAIPILQAANLSLGITVLKGLVGRLASVLGEDFDVEIIERHHRMKKDAPSGTALLLAEALDENRSVTRKHKKGRGNEPRQKGELGLHAVRGGTIVGEHTILFAGTDEAIEITHTALSRKIFALGALRAASFLVKQAPGLYTMDEAVWD